jgi:Flp pilus assembly protein TadD
MRILTFCLVVLLTACTAPLPLRGPLVDERTLLSGDGAGTRHEALPLLSHEQAFGIDDTMGRFVGGTVDGHDDPQERLTLLLEALKERGFASLDYDEGLTGSVRATFYAHTANCLSFTMLFVALAREAGLKASYQKVDVPPKWSKNTEIVVVRNHVNALVEMGGDRGYIVDFNLEDATEGYRRWRVPDAYAESLFYNNLAAEALIRKDYGTSLQYLREALRLDPDSESSWSNLGMWYLRRGNYEYAEAAYLRALRASPGDPTVLTNLVALYTTLGRDELAAVYRQRIRAYQQSNPYYHFAVAQSAFDEGRFDATLAELKHALRLKSDEQEFYLLRARAYVELGRPSEAEQSFTRAKALAAPRRGRAASEAPTPDAGDESL